MRSSVPFSTHLFNDNNIFMSNANTILFQMLVSLDLCSEVP